MKKFFEELKETKGLSEQSAFEAITTIGNGNAKPEHLAAFLGIYAFKGVTVPEFEGFRNGMLSLANQVDFSNYQAMDVCGTGGDGKDTFNISTTAAFVVAGTGQYVSKHGNHGVSSAVGSSTVLEYLGVDFTNEESKLQSKLEAAHICYLHAPLFHPAMRHIGPIRKELGLKTFFNVLGPMLNPSGISKQLVGTFDIATAELFKETLSKSTIKYGIVHGLDGYDEISLTSDALFINENEDLVLKTSDFGFETIDASSLSGGESTADAAEILIAVLENRASKAQANVVLANAALALNVCHPHISLLDCVEMAKESIISGKARQCLKKLSE